VAVSGSYAYVADWDAGLRVVDVSDLAHPQEEGFYDTPGSAWSVAVSGSYAYVADRGSGLRVVDVSDPANPFEEGFYVTPGEAFGVAVSGSYAYVAAGDYGLIILEFIGGTGVEEKLSAAGELPRTYFLSQNYPNPFNACTEIRYKIPEAGHVSLKIFNALGQEIKILVDTHQEAGGYRAIWDGCDVNGREMASGLYFCRLKVGGFSKTVKMALLR
jgi:hypothetical protein